MQHKETFIHEVDKAMPIREEIDTVHAKLMGRLRRMFKNAFSQESTDFTVLKDMLYYKGGYPSEDSPPKMQTLFEKVAIIAKYCTFLGIEEEFECYCKEFGIVVHPMGDPDAYLEADGFESPQDFNLMWAETFVTEPPETKREILKRLLDLALETQGTICELSDKIKDTSGKVVETKCGMPQGVFSQAVRLKHRRYAGGDISDRVQSLIELGYLASEAYAIVNGDIIEDEDENQ